jgi:hypothetical protein
MELSRWFRVIAPLAAIAVIGAVGLVRPPSLQAGDPPWDPPPCPPGHLSAGSGAAWYSLEPVLDTNGWLSGRRLLVGDRAGSLTRRLDLPPEAFASGPVGGRVLVGDDDGTRSRLRVVDVAAGCAEELGREASVVRSAVLSADGSAAWEHRVNRVTRADEGVWRRSRAGGGSVRVLPGLALETGDGPTFSTELLQALDGRLSVASCGEERCHIRVLDPGTGHVARIDDTGPLLGLVRGRAIAYAVCPGLPCPVESIDIASGRRTTLIADAGPAALAGAARPVVVHERSDGRLETVDLVSLRRVLLARPGPGSPIRTGSMATGGADIPVGWVLVAPDGRFADPGMARVVDPDSGTVAPVAEARP